MAGRLTKKYHITFHSSKGKNALQEELLFIEISSKIGEK